MIFEDGEQDLKKKAHNIMSRFQKHAGIKNEELIEWSALVDWMQTHIRPFVCPTTYRKYRAAIVRVSGDENVRKLFTEKATPRSELPILKTSRKRAKWMSNNDLDALKAYAHETHSKWAEGTIRWLEAAMYTGLRPHEWLFAKLSADSQFLVVNNIKLERTIPGYGASERYVPIGYLDKDIQALIKKNLDAIDEFGHDGYPFLYRQSANWLKRANKKCFPRRARTIALMTPRHQFNANLKASKLSPKEIAYLVGHATDARSYESYGSKRHGSSIGITADHAPNDALNKIREKIEQKWASQHVHTAELVDNNDDPKHK